MVNNIVIERPEKEDTEAIRSITSDTWKTGQYYDTYTRYGRTGTMEDYIGYVIDKWITDRSALVAKSGGKAIGIIHIEKLPDGFCNIGGLRIDSRFRKNGIGTILLNAAIDSIRETSKGARLSIYSWNVPSMNLANKNGFRKIDEFRVISGSFCRESDANIPDILLQTGGYKRYSGKFFCHFIDWKYICMVPDEIIKYYPESEIIIPSEKTLINVMRNGEESDVVIDDAEDPCELIQKISALEKISSFYIRNKIINGSEDIFRNEDDPVYLNIYEMCFS